MKYTLCATFMNKHIYAHRPVIFSFSMSLLSHQFQSKQREFEQCRLFPHSSEHWKFMIRSQPWLQLRMQLSGWMLSWHAWVLGSMPSTWKKKKLHGGKKRKHGSKHEDSLPRGHAEQVKKCSIPSVTGGRWLKLRYYMCLQTDWNKHRAQRKCWWEYRDANPSSITNGETNGATL